MIPDGWVVCSFGDIVIKSQYGLSVPSSPDGKYYIFKMNNFKDGKMNHDKVDKVNLSDTDLDKFTLKYGDLLVNRTNSIDLVGKTGVFDLEGVFTFASYLVRFQVNRAIADPFFVNFFFNWSKSQKKLKEIATLGVSQANINPTSLQKYFNLLLPPLAEQRKIAEILGAWDEAIALLEKLIAAKRQLKQGLMQQLLTGKTRFKEFEGSEYAIKSLGEITKTFSGGTPSRSNLEYYSGNIPWIKSGELNTKSIWFTEEKITQQALKNSSAKLVLPNTILVAMYGATAGVIGISRITAAINQAILAVVPNDSCINDYLFYFLEYSMVEVIKKVQGGQPNLNAQIIKSSSIRLPLLPEQEKIASVLWAADTEISTLEKQLAAYKQQKRGLMQQLLTGKIRVNVN